MESVGIVTASQLLGICRQRIQQLIYAERVKGAYKTKQGWQIPLYKGMPQIAPAKRGVKGTWRLKPSREKIIHVNKGTIGGNKGKTVKKPVIIVRKGSKTVYGHEVYFEGKCKMVYEPAGNSNYSGAQVWIEVPSTTKVTIIDWNKEGEDRVMILD